MEIFQQSLKQYNENNEEDLTIYSDIPPDCKTKACYVGIDEAGRGPVLGAMVYGIFACVGDEEKISEMQKKEKSLIKIEENPPTMIDKFEKLNDSKQITDKVREVLVEQMADLDYIAFGLKFISPAQISQKSFRRQKYGLNEISHNAAMELIEGLLQRGVKISKVFVDTVGPMEKYQKKLELQFPEFQFKVDKKADSKYKVVSAASVFAKVARDGVLNAWKYPEGLEPNHECGSGYPGDPTTKKFLRENLNPIFGFPTIVRDSWQTSTTLMSQMGVSVTWEDIDEEKNDAAKNFTNFFSKIKTDSNGEKFLQKPKTQFFSYRNLEQIVDF